MARFVTTAGLALSAGAAFVLAPPALAAESVPSPTVSATAGASASDRGGDDSLQALILRAAPSPRPSLPTVAVPVAPGAPQQSATPRPSDGTGDIEVPAGKADVSAPGRTDDLLTVVLAGGGALLLAGGAVVVVSRRRA